MKHLLVGVDGSESARRAVSFAAHLAKSIDARLTLAHVIHSWPVPPEALAQPEYTAAFEQSRRQEAERLLQEEQSRCLREAGVLASGRVLEGNPAPALLDFARKEDVDLIVVGTRGLGAFSRLVVGSTSSKLVHLAEKPVVVVP